MAKMRIYTVHINPRKKNPYESPIFVEEGFNIYAFLFRPFWALAHRLWLAAAILFTLLIGGELLVAMEILAVHVFGVITLGVMVYTGFQGNDWRRNKLKRQGYIISDIVTSDNLVGAEQRYFERYYPYGRLPQTPPQNPPQKPSIPAPA